MLRAFNIGLEHLEVGLTSVGASKPHYQVENIDSRLRQLPHRNSAQAQHVAHNDIHAAGIAFPDEGTTFDAFLQSQHAGHLETAQRLAQNVAADAELLRQISLGWQLVARFEDTEG